MQKILNTFLTFIILVFFVSIYKYYISNKNIETKSFNRNNINEIINKKISDLPILNNDTDDIIVFNDGFSDEIKNDKLRSFWNLLKSE